VVFDHAAEQPGYGFGDEYGFFVFEAVHQADRGFGQAFVAVFADGRAEHHERCAPFLDVIALRKLGKQFFPGAEVSGYFCNGIGTGAEGIYFGPAFQVVEPAVEQRGIELTLRRRAVIQQHTGYDLFGTRHTLHQAGEHSGKGFCRQVTVCLRPLFGDQPQGRGVDGVARVGIAQVGIQEGMLCGLP
jgi:hypothetical protein